MKLYLQRHNVRPSNQLDTWIEKHVLALGLSRHIEKANIRLAHLHEESPAYQVNVHLITPGPDVFAEGRDHTIRAAFDKVMRQLREQILSRARKTIQRAKIRLSAPSVRTRGSLLS